MKRSARWRALALGVACGGLLPRPAAADTTDECIGESEAGQKLLLERRFVESRPHLISCGRAQCPSLVVRDCVDRLRQAEASVASVVLSANLADGRDPGDVTAFVDDAPEGRRLTGEATTINPGSHTFRFERPDGRRVVRQITVAEGARLQHVVVTFSAPAEPAATSSSSTRKVAGVVIGSVGVAGLIAGGILVAVAESAASTEHQACLSSTCGVGSFNTALGDYHTATDAATASTVTFVAGGALVALGGLLWLTAPKVASSSSASLYVVPSVDPHTGGLLLAGIF